MPEFTRVDRNLLMRVTADMRGEATTLAEMYGANWGKDVVHRDRKRRHDRVLRDAGDLEALRRRLEAAHPESTKALAPSAKVEA